MATAPLDPVVAVERLADRVSLAAVERLTGDNPALAGRVLAAPVPLDRDSPACDVSAMDGFAVRFDELRAGSLPVVGECRIGEPPVRLETGAARRIYTGSPLPEGADTVVRLERVTESLERIALIADSAAAAGGDIRRKGENAAAGSVVLEAGLPLTAAAIGALATAGPPAVEVRRRLRLAVITTGNELASGAEALAPDLPAWRLRDSNGPSVQAMFASTGWVESVERLHAADSLEELTATLAAAIERCDAVMLTGGVSKGAYDYVPDAVRAAGGEVVFHRIRARPGQPTLGAVARGKPIFGLPGNPLSVLSTARRIATPVLRRVAGFTSCEEPVAVAELTAWSGKTLPITWWRPVVMRSPGVAQLASLRGSGDVCGPAATDGFVAVPPETEGVGPYPFYSWTPH